MVSHNKSHLTLHLDYLNGDLKRQRQISHEMCLKGIGPVSEEDALKIVKHLQQLTKEFFLDKPADLKSKPSNFKAL